MTFDWWADSHPLRVQHLLNEEVNNLFWGGSKRISNFSKPNLSKTNLIRANVQCECECVHLPFEKENHKSQKDLFHRHHTHIGLIKCLSPVPHIASTNQYWKRNEIASFRKIPSKARAKEKKVIQSQSRRKQLKEINSCERLNEMEEYSRIDCFQSAVSFVLCFNFDKEKIYYRKNNGRDEERGALRKGSRTQFATGIRLRIA